MKRIIQLWTCTLVTAALISAPLLADELHIRHKPFNGTMVGSCRESAALRVDLKGLCEALDLKLQAKDHGYFVEGATATVQADKVAVGQTSLSFTREGEQALVNLKEFLDAVGGRMTFSPDTGILDVVLPKKTGPAGSDWGTASAYYKLIFFGTDSAPAAKHFKPILKQVEKDSKTPVVWVDTNQTHSDNYINYIHFFQGNMIPHTVLVSQDGKVWKRWTGSIPLGKFATEVKSIVSKPR